jgi:hypothetical protein
VNWVQDLRLWAVLAELRPVDPATSLVVLAEPAAQSLGSVEPVEPVEPVERM